MTTPETHRWNYETDSEGVVWVCKGEHDKALGCQWERAADPAPSREPTAPMTETPCATCGGIPEPLPLRTLQHRCVCQPASPPPVAPIARETETPLDVVRRVAMTQPDIGAARGYIEILEGEIARLRTSSLPPTSRGIETYTREEVDAALSAIRGDFDWSHSVLSEEIARLTASSASSQRVGEAAREFAREIATNFDHDADAHRYDTMCRVCLAEAFLAEHFPPSTHTPRG